MGKVKTHGRTNQQLRTRKDLLLAAARLLKAGRKPSMDEVAEEALVSRATAYRYFPTVESLLVEAPLDAVTPEPSELFAQQTSLSPEERVDLAEEALHNMVCANEAQLRLLLAYSLNADDPHKRSGALPHRQNRRTSLIHEALLPIRDKLDAAAYERLCAALALIFGPESMVVFRDVLEVDATRARAVKSWAVRTLVRAALEEADTRD